MNQEELRKRFYELYDMMASGHDVEKMRVFGCVHKEMMEWMISNRPTDAQEWIDKLESIRWHNYLTPKEAELIVANMTPKAPWSREQWAAAMERNGYPLEKEPCYNKCALWVTMNMIMSDSGNTLSKYVDGNRLFAFVHELALDKLQDEDKMFSIRSYFGV